MDYAKSNAHVEDGSTPLGDDVRLLQAWEISEADFL